MFGEFDGRCLDLFCDGEYYDIAIIKPLNVFTYAVNVYQEKYMSRN